MVKTWIAVLAIIAPLIASSATLGINTSYMEPSVSPKADLFRYANGHWLDHTEIPPDRASFSLDAMTQVKTEAELQQLLKEMMAASLEEGSTPWKLASLYRDMMDVERINALGRAPIDDVLRSVDQVANTRELPALFAHLSQIGVTLPFDINIGPDERNADVVRVHVGQSDLVLPDRSYYLDRRDPKFRAIRTQYSQYQRALLKDLGIMTRSMPEALFSLERDWARDQWPREKLRDPTASYHPMSLKELNALTPGFDWGLWWQVAGIPSDGVIIVGQPDYLKKAVARLHHTPLPILRAWLKFSVLRAFSPYLDEARQTRVFNFESHVLRGIPEQKSRDRQALMVLEQAMGEGLGEAYVKAYFPESRKARIEALVSHLIDAYDESIRKLNWLNPETRLAALDKLHHIRLKLAYPNHWRDYSALVIYPGELVRSLRSAALFESKRMVESLRHPTDRDEWAMTPQTVNAYYNPSMNEIVFPAAQLQAPYFDPEADDAANYGNIGFIIGHELSHAFDDEGAQFDANGNLRDWWSKEDHEEFKKRTSVLVKQYGTVSPLPGLYVNGELTLGENIADNVGLLMAWRAYQASLKGEPAPVIDGFTGAQRFFISYAQSWMGKEREESLMRLLKTDPHAPESVRTNLTVRNQEAFYSAFGITPQDPVWIDPAARFSLW